MMYAYTENFVMPLSHDEVVHGKGSLLNKIPGDRWQQFATLRALYAYMWAHPGKQLLFMGQEFGQGGEWAEARSLDWWLLDDPGHRGVSRLISDLNRTLPRHAGAVVARHHPDGFHWIDANDAAGNVYSFLRFGDDGSVLACVANFSAGPARGLPARPAVRRPVGRGRSTPTPTSTSAPGVGNFGGGRGDRRAVARPAGLDPAARAAARRALAALRGAERDGSGRTLTRTRLARSQGSYVPVSEVSVVRWTHFV